MVILAVLAFSGCENSDVVPPSDAVVNISANPATLAFKAGDEKPESLIRARVTNSIGVSLPGQTVVFDTTEGGLTPRALTPIETDDYGIATTILATVRTATVTAYSGNVSDQLTITVLAADLQDLIFVDAENTLTNCNDVLRITVAAVDTTGLRVSDVGINFSLRDQNGTPGSSPGIAGTFSPISGFTDANGEMVTNWFPDINDCTTKCAGGLSCNDTTSIVAVDLSQTFESIPLVILDAVP